MVGNPKAASQIDEHVGGRIRMRRLAVGVSQSGLAEAIGVTFQQVQKYEKGANRVGITRLVQIAHVLRTTVDFFVEGAPGTSPCDTNSNETETSGQILNFLGTKEGIALVHGFAAITDPSARKAIIDLVAALAPKAIEPSGALRDREDRIVGRA